MMLLVVPSTRVKAFKAAVPVIDASFIAPSATVIGDVKIGKNSSVWYGAVVKGDKHNVTIGSDVTVGDRAMIHSKNSKSTIGNKVIISAGATVNGCFLDDESFVGVGAQVHDGAKISKFAMVAAGSIVNAKTIIPSGQLWSGIPAVYLRDLTSAEIASISKNAASNVELSTIHSLEVAKSWETIETEEYDYEQKVNRNESYYKRLTPEQLAYKEGLLENNQMHPGRIFDSQESARGMNESRP